MTESREETPTDPQDSEDDLQDPQEDTESQDPRDGGKSKKDSMYPASNPDSGPAIQPGVGGYEGRDPATDVPRMPSIPETQDD
ncbi:MAG: hypothetical protein M3071_12005 [Actinomycetota bacterium]|nr:hypothetical protein [Actinomycetota bacterium]